MQKRKKRGHRSSGKEGDQASSVNLIYICTTENGTLSMILYGLHRGRPLSLPTVRHKLTSQCTQVKAFCKPETLTGSEFLSFFVLYSRLLADFLSHLGKWVKLIKFETENEFFCTWKVEKPQSTTSSP